MQKRGDRHIRVRAVISAALFTVLHGSGMPAGGAEDSWSRTYPTDEDDQVASIRQIADGGFVAAGWTYPYGLGRHIRAPRLNEQGDIPPQAVVDASPVYTVLAELTTVPTMHLSGIPREMSFSLNEKGGLIVSLPGQFRYQYHFTPRNIESIRKVLGIVVGWVEKQEKALIGFTGSVECIKNGTVSLTVVTGGDFDGSRAPGFYFFDVSNQLLGENQFLLKPSAVRTVLQALDQRNIQRQLQRMKGPKRNTGAAYIESVPAAIAL